MPQLGAYAGYNNPASTNAYSNPAVAGTPLQQGGVLTSGTPLQQAQAPSTGVTPGTASQPGTPLQQLGYQNPIGSPAPGGGTSVVNPGGVITSAQSNYPLGTNGVTPNVNVNGLSINPNNLKEAAPLTILPALGNSTAEGNAAYNSSQPLQNAYTQNLNANPYSSFLQTGSTNNAGVEGMLSAYGINTTPNQAPPGTVTRTAGKYTQPDGSVNNGLGVTVSADQVNGLTPAQQTQLNGYIGTTTEQQQTALSSFQSQMESRFGAGAISPEAAAVGQQLITQAYQAQVDQQVASYQTQAQQTRQQGLTAIEGQGATALQAQQQQTLAEQESLQQQSQNANALDVSAGSTLGNLGLGMSAQNNSLSLGSIIGGLGSLGSGVADVAGAFSSGSTPTAQAPASSYTGPDGAISAFEYA